MNRNKALLSLLLLIPTPSVGILAGMVFWPNTAIGKGLFLFSKLWLFGLPALWYLLIDKGKLSLSPACKGGFGFGLLSGGIITGIILMAHYLLGPIFLENGVIVDKISQIGLSTPLIYLGGAIYWVSINSVLEEYVWRWFVTKQYEELFRPQLAVLCSAVCFTLHHAIALNTFMPPIATAICSAGIFIGGAVWSYMYVKYESIWPGYLSHAIVDLCIFGIGAFMIFG